MVKLLYQSSRVFYANTIYEYSDAKGQGHCNVANIKFSSWEFSECLYYSFISISISKQKQKKRFTYNREYIVQQKLNQRVNKIKQQIRRDRKTCIVKSGSTHTHTHTCHTRTRPLNIKTPFIFPIVIKILKPTSTLYVLLLLLYA